jgi:hypothetical protein
MCRGDIRVKKRSEKKRRDTKVEEEEEMGVEIHRRSQIEVSRQGRILRGLEKGRLVRIKTEDKEEC